jgi:hypothetical protein
MCTILKCRDDWNMQEICTEIARPGEIKLENHTGEAPKFSIE